MGGGGVEGTGGRRISGFPSPRYCQEGESKHIGDVCVCVCVFIWTIPFLIWVGLRGNE